MDYPCRIVTIRGQIEVVKDSLVHLAVPKERFCDEPIRISAPTLVEKSIEDCRDGIGDSDFKVLV